MRKIPCVTPRSAHILVVEQQIHATFHIWMEGAGLCPAIWDGSCELHGQLRDLEEGRGDVQGDGWDERMFEVGGQLGENSMFGELQIHKNFFVTGDHSVTGKIS